VATDARPPNGAPREPTRRLFFALWPDEPMRQAMAQAIRGAARASGGRPVPAGNLHVTLAFLGSLPERRLAELGEAARGLAEALRCPAGTSASEGPLELIFDRLEHWPAAQLLCALPAEPPARVAVVARALQDALVGRGFTPDLKPFRPHVTVARKVVHASTAAKMHPVSWRFTELALIESRTLREGALYSVVESYSLCGAEKGSK
jgi:2'-5' RNA ligase